MNGIISAYFTENDAPKTGLTVTVDIEQVPLDGTAPSMFATGASMTESSVSGFYRYHSSSFDTSTYKYHILAKTTATDVDVQNIPASLSLLEGSVVGSLPTSGDIADTVWDEPLSGHAIAGSTGLQLSDVLLDTDSRLDNLDSAISVIPTNPLLTNDARLDNLDATISSRATQVSVNSIPTNPLLTNDARLDNLDATISSRATQASVDALPTNATITDAVWDELLSGHVISGSAGLILSSLPTLSQIGTGVWAQGTRTLTAGTKDAEIDAIKAKTDNLPASPASSTEVAAVPGDVWDEALAGHLTAGTTGEALSDASDPANVDTDAVADAVWDELLAGHVIAGSAAVELSGTFKTSNIGAITSDVWGNATRTLTAGTKDAEIDAIKAKTDNLPADPAGVSDVPTTLQIWTYATRTLTAGTKDAEIDAIKAKTDNLPADPASLTNLNAQTISIINGVWDEPLASHTNLNSMGWKLGDLISAPSVDVDDYKADVSNLALQTTAQAIKSKTDNLPLDPASESQLQSDITAAVTSTITGVWSEDLTSYNTVGSAGLALKNASLGGDPSVLADAVWSRSLTNYNISLTAGQQLKAAALGSDPDAISDAVWDKQTSENMVIGSFGRVLQDKQEAPSSNLADYKADISSLATSAALALVQADTVDLLQTINVDGVIVDSGEYLNIASEVLKFDISTVEDTAPYFSITGHMLTALNSTIVEISEFVGEHIIYKTTGVELLRRPIALESTAKPIVGVGDGA